MVKSGDSTSGVNGSGVNGLRNTAHDGKNIEQKKYIKGLLPKITIDFVTKI